MLSHKIKKYTAGLAPEFCGPFRIVKKCSPLWYQLETLDGVKCGTWHVEDLKLLCFSLHIENLPLEDSESSHGC